MNYRCERILTNQCRKDCFKGSTQLRFDGYGKAMEDWELGEEYITKRLWQCKRGGHLDMIGSGTGMTCDFAFEAASGDPRAPSTSLSMAGSRLRREKSIYVVSEGTAERRSVHMTWHMLQY
jgi:hypothetical protein